MVGHGNYSSLDHQAIRAPQRTQMKGVAAAVSIAAVTSGLMGFVCAAVLLRRQQQQPALQQSGLRQSGLQQSGLRGIPETRLELTSKEEKATSCGLMEEDTDYHTATALYNKQSVDSAEDCCQICESEPVCGAWSWGKMRGVPGLTDVCFLKGWRIGETFAAVRKDGIISGLPAKRGSIRPGPPGPPKAPEKDEHSTGMCPGILEVLGYNGKVGNIALTNAGRDNPLPVEVADRNKVVAHIGGRTYFANSCIVGDYAMERYAKVKLLGKVLRYTVNLVGAGCGCNAAFYLSAMHPEPGDCAGDHYCDAQTACGNSCAEIDLQQANQYSFLSSLHTYHSTWGPDKLGKSLGFGGSENLEPRRDWTAAEYGPGAKCVNTAEPFHVAVGFPTDIHGKLAGLEVTLSQKGRECNLSSSLGNYKIDWPNTPESDGLEQLSAVLSNGMVPVIRYDSSDSLLWLDGKSSDGQGPCAEDNAKMCVDSVSFYDISIEDGAVLPKPTEIVPGTTTKEDGAVLPKPTEIAPGTTTKEAGSTTSVTTSTTTLAPTSTTLTTLTSTELTTTTTVSTTTASTTTRTETTTTTKGETFDCEVDESSQDWKESWSLAQALWCCKHKEVGCLPVWDEQIV